NGEVPSDTALSHGAAAPGRQRPEEILAQTLSAPSHPEATDGWSSRGRRLFLIALRSEEHTSELQSQSNLVCRLLLEKKKVITNHPSPFANQILPAYQIRPYLVFQGFGAGPAPVLRAPKDTLIVLQLPAVRTAAHTPR